MGPLMPCSPLQFIASSSLPIMVAIGAVLFVAVILWIADRRNREREAKSRATPRKSKDIRIDEVTPGASAARGRSHGKPGASAGGDSKPKTAEQIFKEAFPELKVAPVPLPPVPFSIRVTEIDAATLKDGRSRPCLRVEVCGSVPLDSASELTLLLTVEDLTASTTQHVFATVDTLQDERTGLFVERAKLGKIDPPGLRHSGWREIALIPTSFLQAPRSGRRRLRFSCIGVPSANSSVSVIDPLLRSTIHCTSMAEVEAELPVKGYLEDDDDREQAAGMVLCVAWGFAHAHGAPVSKAAPVMSAWSAQAPSLLCGTTGQPSASLARILDGADKLGLFGGIGYLEACAMLARSHVPEAPLMAFELCCKVAKTAGSAADDAYSLLRDGALAMGVSTDEFARLIQTHLGGVSQATDEELVGLDPSWSKEQIGKFLREQFGKWNARSGGVSSYAERQKIAIRLNTIAKLRQKYR